MRVKGDARASFEIDKELDGRSWVHSLDWSPVVYEKMNLSTVYPKGTQTTSKTITFHQLINSIAEQILTIEKSRFRTLSEVFRCALHLGIQVLWYIIKVNPEIIKSTRGQSFFDSLTQEGDIFVKAQIVECFDNHIKRVKEFIDHGKISEEDGRESIKKAWDKIPHDDKEFVYRAFYSRSKERNIIDVKTPIRDKYRDLLTF